MAHGASAPKPDTARHSLPSQEPGNTARAVQSRRGSAGKKDMGNLCSPWKCPSPFKRKKEKQGAHARHEAQQQQPGRKVPTYEDVPAVPVYAAAPGEEESIHYADIQLCGAGARPAAPPRGAHGATEYATLHFPSAGRRCDSTNGTLV